MDDDDTDGAGDGADADAQSNDPSPTEPPERVGYGHPPKEHRIKPGERKNPNGRPKGSCNGKTILRREHSRPIGFHDGKKRRRKPAIEVMIRGDVAAALKGDEKAKARQIGLALRLGEEDEAKAAVKAQRDTLAEDEAILARYLPPAVAKPNGSDEEPK